jgi:hypothetical protein
MPMRLPTHACLHTHKSRCIVIGGPVSLTFVVEAYNCRGRSGSCSGLLIGPSRDNAIAAAHAISLALSPLSHQRCRPHHNWRLPSPDAVTTHRRTWHCCPFFVYTRGFVAYPAPCHSDLAFVGLASVALVALPALHWCPHPQCAGIIASVALSLSPALHRRCPLVARASSPLLCKRCNFCRPRVTASHANRRLPTHDVAATCQRM